MLRQRRDGDQTQTTGLSAGAKATLDVCDNFTPQSRAAIKINNKDRNLLNKSS
jgi:hypothetical protein